MRCPKCNSKDTTVNDSRESGTMTRRRRECMACNHVFTTYELSKEEYDKKIKLSDLLAQIVKVGVERE